MNSRREFTVSMAALAGAMAGSKAVLGANDRIRLGVIGLGAQGTVDTRAALKCANVELTAVADVFTKRLEDSKKLAPTAKTYLDYRYLLEDKNVDAVLIATPQHLHCEHFVAALDAGKHVYQEKTMAFTVEHAKRMRAAYQRAGKRTVQIGHQRCTGVWISDAVNFMKTGNVGKVTEVHAHHYRNTAHDEPQWSRPVLPEMTKENIIWTSFLGEASPRPFDANRYINWRFFWDYSGGNFYENMCHQLASWYKILNLRIPKAVTTTGGIYVWKDGREVPDTMCASMEHPEELLFNWSSGFGNSELGSSVDVLGTDGTIMSSPALHYKPQKVNRPDGTEVAGQKEPPGNPYQLHMQNFMDCIRSGNEPSCPVELGFRVSIACRMAVESYRQRRTVTWDPVKEEIG
jgi:predicted dehydrogenase